MKKLKIQMAPKLAYKMFLAKFAEIMHLERHELKNLIIQCNLDYLDLVYPEPRLSGLARDLKIHYHACAKGVTNDLLWVWL